MSHFETGTQLLSAAQKSSTGFKRHAKIRSEILAIAELKNHELQNWTADDILDYLLAYMRNSTKRLKNKTLLQVLVSVKDVFTEMGLDTFIRNQKSLSCAMNHLRTERLKESDSDERTKKPKLINVRTWIKILQLVLGPSGRTQNEKAWNRVVGVVLVWALSSGGRIGDVLSLEKRDLFRVFLPDGDMCINAEIRSGKSNRYGDRDSRLVLFRKKNNEMFCPIESYDWLWHDFPWLKGGKFAIPNPDNISEAVATESIMSRLRTRCKILKLPKEQRPNAHSARTYFINYAIMMNVPAERIARSVNWSSSEMLSHYIQNAQYLSTAPNRTIASTTLWSNIEEDFIPIRKESFYM